MFFEDDLPDPNFVLEDNLQLLFYYTLILFLVKFFIFS